MARRQAWKAVPAALTTVLAAATTWVWRRRRGYGQPAGTPLTPAIGLSTDELPPGT